MIKNVKFFCRQVLICRQSFLRWGSITLTSTDAVNGSQLYQTNQNVSDLGDRVNKLGIRVNKVGAAAAAMANLHPIDDPDSKFNMAAAVGSYPSETTAAIGLFYKPTNKIQFNMSTALGNSENMFGAGITFALDRMPKREKEGTKVKELQAKVDDQQAQLDELQAKLDALLTALGQDNKLSQAAE